VSGEVLEAVTPSTLGVESLSLASHGRQSPNRDSRSWRVTRVALTIAYLAATLILTNWHFRSQGRKYEAKIDWLGAIPTDREVIVVWMVGLFLVNLVGRPRKDLVQLIVSWAPFLVALFLYDFARSVGFRIHGRDNPPIMVMPQIRADEFLFGGRLPTTILQERYYKPAEIKWYDIMVAGVYTSHFLVPYLFAGVLWAKWKRLWRWYAGTFVAVNFFSCVIFAAITTAPPWWAARENLIPSFERKLAGRGWSKIGLNLVARLIDKGQDTVNPYAAIPSLHSAQALLIVACLWPLVWKWVRPFLFIYPVAMTFALVYSGEHYFVDVLIGWFIVAGFLVAGFWLREWKKWRSPFLEPSFTSTAHLSTAAAGQLTH
jgi:hypothetical protein